MNILAFIRANFFAYPEPTRFYHEEPNALTALQKDGRRARTRIDESTYNDRDRLLERLLRGSYPEDRSQDC